MEVKLFLKSHLINEHGGGALTGFPILYLKRMKPETKDYAYSHV